MSLNERHFVGIVLVIAIALGLAPIAFNAIAASDDYEKESCKSLLSNCNRIISFIDAKLQMYKHRLPSIVSVKLEHLKSQYDEALRLYKAGKYEESTKTIMGCTATIREIISILNREGLLEPTDKVQLRALGLLENLRIIYNVLLKIRDRIENLADKSLVERYNQALNELENIILELKGYYDNGEYGNILKESYRVRAVLTQISLILGLIGKKTSYSKLLAIKENYARLLDQLENEVNLTRDEISKLSRVMGVQATASELSELLTGIREYRSILEKIREDNIHDFARSLSGITSDIIELKRTIEYIPEISPFGVKGKELSILAHRIMENKSIPEEVKQKLKEAWGYMVNASRLMRLSIHLALRGYVKKSLIALHKSKDLYLNASAILKNILEEYHGKLPKRLITIIERTISRIEHIVSKEIPRLAQDIRSVAGRTMMAIRDKVAILTFLTLTLRRKAAINNDTETVELANKTLVSLRELIKACKDRNMEEIKNATETLVSVCKELVEKAGDKYPRLTKAIGRIIREIIILLRRLLI